MCGRMDTTSLTWADIHDQLSGWGTVVTSPMNLEPNDDVRPTTRQITARLESEGWVLEPMRWGLVPYWRNGKPLKDTTKGANDGFNLTTFNARCETVVTASTFRESFKKRRCIAPASAYYEWTGDKGSKVKHRFSRVDGTPIWFAGLWDKVTTPDAGDFSSFTILTSPSDGVLADYHGRAPVMLDPDEWVGWLQGGAPNLDVRADRFVCGLA